MNRPGLHSFAVRATLPLCILVLSLASAVACVRYALDTRPSCDLEGAQRGVGVRAIEEITVGDRVVGEHPTGEFDVSLGTEVNSRTWKKIVLAANKADGSTADVVLLRPDWWVQEHSAEPFNIIPIHVPECGIDGDAMVLDIGPCPRIKPGTAPIVIGCFRHQSAEVIDISVDGAGEPIGTTANHPIWSEDRVAFVRADALSIGERVRLRDGVARLTSIAPRGPPEPVYNIEVLGHHVYHVGQSGLLVHNGGPCPEFIARVRQLRSQGLKGDDLRRAIEVEFPPVRDAPTTPKFFTSQSTWKAPAKGTGQTYKVFRQDIDWNLKVKGKTNAQWASEGKAPYVVKNGRAEQVQLHHSRQNAQGPLFELSRSTHLGTKSGAGREALHPYGRSQHPDFPVDRPAFGVDRGQYWIDRVTEAGRFAQ